MARGTRNHLARLLEGESVAGMTDGQLLDRFTTRRGAAAESAFEALVARHGPMVARVCRNLLRDEHDVEDAFQATFLVLVRRANSIGERDLLAPWLYGVAHRVARKARAVALRRRGREGGPAGIDPPARLDPSVGLQVDLAPVLHEEVDRLPEKYRRPVILCHLQGLTHAEAARELAWPVGTVSVRLVRARKILADRLTRRGVTASTTLVATSLATEATATALAPSWIQAAAVAALAASSGLPFSTATAAASAGAITLARRTSMTMLLSSWKWFAVPLTVALATTTGAVLMVSPAADDNSPDPAKAIPPINSVTATDISEPQAEIDESVAQREVEGDQPVNFRAENMVIRGKVSNLAKTVEKLKKSDPNATFRLHLSGGKLQYQDSTPDGKQQPAEPSAPPEVEPPPNVEPPVVVRANGELDLDPPPGYFDLPASKSNEPGVPQPVKIGQTVQIDVIEALPGRPLAGNRVVRPDGTISLSWYGDLLVVGLNRDQIKVKLIEKLRIQLKDSVLGLIASRDDKFFAVPPLQSNRIFVDDQPELPPTAPAAKEPTDKRAATAPPRSVSGPVPVKVGQILVVEVLEALPGRPLTGERVVRPDGTISLGWYGDLAVVGLTRDQIKVKVVEHLRKFLDDEKLGLRIVSPRTQKVETVPPLQTDRVFVDDDLDWNPNLATEPTPDGKVQVGQILVIEALEALPGRPISGWRIVKPDGMINLGFYGDVAVVGLTRNEIKAKVIEHLRTKLTDEQLGLVKVDVKGQKTTVAPVDSDRVYVEDSVQMQKPRTGEAVEGLRGQVADLSGKLDAALEAIEQLRRDRKGEPSKAESPRTP